MTNSDSDNKSKNHLSEDILEEVSLESLMERADQVCPNIVSNENKTTNQTSSNYSSYSYESFALFFFKTTNWFLSFLYIEPKVIKLENDTNRELHVRHLKEALSEYQSNRDESQTLSLYEFLSCGFVFSYLLICKEDYVIDKLIKAMNYENKEISEDESNLEPIDYSYFSYIRNNALGATLRSYLKKQDNATAIGIITGTTMPTNQADYTVSEFVSALNNRVNVIKTDINKKEINQAQLTL